MTNNPKPNVHAPRFAGAVYDEANADIGNNAAGEKVVRIDLTYGRGPGGVEYTMILSIDAAIALRNHLDAAFAAGGIDDGTDDHDDDLAGLDSYDLLRFAKRYASLGDAVCSQLDDLLAGNTEGVNPNAVELMRDRLGGLNEDIDDALESYADAHSADAAD